MAVAAVVVALAAALLAADRIAVVRVQGRIAAQVEGWGFPAGPHVKIAGFPFLTQLAARRLGKVVIRAAGKSLGPVQVKHFDITLYGVPRRPRRHGQDRLAAVRHRPGRLCGPAGSGRMPGRAVRAGHPGGMAPGFVREIAFSLSAMPLAMMIQSVSVTSQGVHLHLAGRNVRFG